MSPPKTWTLSERQLLQIAVAIFGCIPVGAGLAGVLFGLDVFDPNAVLNRNLDSHGRYLSGLLAAIGLAFWSCIPRVETHASRARLLTAIVFAGGLATPPAGAATTGMRDSAGSLSERATVAPGAISTVRRTTRWPGPVTTRVCAPGRSTSTRR